MLQLEHLKNPTYYVMCSASYDLAFFVLQHPAFARVSNATTTAMEAQLAQNRNSE